MRPSFSTLPLRPALLEALARLEYTAMTPIQAQSLPRMLAGADVIGQARTGSGKTAAFGLGLLQGLDADAPDCQALVLCPTRELAEQVAEELRRLAWCLPNARVVTLCGGYARRDQVQALAGPRPIVVGTPGRVGDLLDSGDLSVKALRTLVLDEGDRMLEMGFLEQVTAIVRRCPGARQTHLFSATIPEGIADLSRRVQRDPQLVVAETAAAPAAIRQLVFPCTADTRHDHVARLLARYRPASSLVFVETRAECEALTAALRERGAVALALHGDMEQRDRADVLLQLTNGSLTVLVATNVAARGLDIPALPAVIIAELSRDPEDHLHRVGRTGRAGEAGLALSLVAGPAEQRRLDAIEAFLGQPLIRGPALPEARDLRALTPPNRTLLLLAGRRDKLRKGDVLGALVKDGGFPPEAIGRIDVLETTCAVAVSRAHAHAVLKFTQAARIKKARVKAHLLG
ncbi:MAG: ATP-dependent RNA helicase DbpA [Myxococcales bacterium]|nr:ATP-dependent RNA helicase DbpA [Myxococcales bacterium]